jgi:hypothetical protein
MGIARLNLTNIAAVPNPPANTVVLAVDLDGLLKMKNSLGVITIVGGGGGGDIFTSDIVVSLSGGKSIGKYVDGDTIPSTGLTAEQVLNLIGIEDIAPTYTVATLVLTDSASNQDEVGTLYSDSLTASFTQNDAGALNVIRIQKNGADMIPNGSSSPFIKADFGSYVLGNITFIAYADYGAGIIQNYSPSGNPDARTPLVRNVNAPQAAEVAFASNTVTLTGTYKIFYGDSVADPITSAAVRALPSNRFTDAGNTFILNTGSTNTAYTVAMPTTMSLVSVFDIDALNANITANYIVSTFNVDDAGGTPVSYKVYTMTNGVPYASNHQHQITVS